MAFFQTTLAGLALSRGSTRRATLLFATLALYLYVAPVALASYDVRYGVPAGLMLSVAGALGGWAVLQRGRVVNRDDSVVVNTDRPHATD